MGCNVSATAIRKAAVTLVHEKESNMAEDMANLMAHNVSTAKNHYRLVEKKAMQAAEHSKLCLRHEYRMVLHPDLKLHLTMCRRPSGAGGKSVITGST